jgi:hypothetical protein
MTNGYGPNGTLDNLASVEDMARASITNSPSAFKEARESFLSPGKTIGDVLLRAAWEPHQLDAGARMLAKWAALEKMAGRKLPDDIKHIAEIKDHGVRILMAEGLLQAGVDGGARKEALSAHTMGGLVMGMAGRGKRGLGNMLRRATGRGEKSSLEVG